MSRPPRPTGPATAAPHGPRVDAAAAEPRPIVICEECGRKYSVSPSKIRGSAAGFTCRHCGHRIVVARSEGSGRIEAVGGPVEPAPPEIESSVPLPVLRPSGRRAALPSLAVWAGITAAAVAAAAGLFVIRTQAELAELERHQVHAARQLAAQQIDQIAAGAAERVRLILASQPGLSPGDFARSPELRAIAMQPVGRTGQMLVAAMPESDGIWRVWLHPDPRRVGADLGSLVSDADPLFPDVWKSINRAAYGSPSVGYHRVRAADGTFKGQALACYPVTGTNYILAAAAPVEELSAPLIEVQTRAGGAIREMGFTAAGLLGGTLLAAAVAAWFLVIRRSSLSRGEKPVNGDAPPAGRGDEMRGPRP